MDIPGLWQELEDVLRPMLASYRSRLTSLHVERKADNTFLSEADLAVQEQIIRCIRAVDPDGFIVAEERREQLAPSRGDGTAGRAWIIDPIDGTAQFITPAGREYCSVVCLAENHTPIAAFVLAPEIGHAHSPVTVRLSPGQSIEVNGRESAHPPRGARNASLTRSRGTPAPAYEEALKSLGYQIKNRTTSQTLDMVRASVDLALVTEPRLDSFGLFYRERQKVWDGAAGMCFASAAGIFVGDNSGHQRDTINIPLNDLEPQYESTLVAADLEAAQIVLDSLKHSNQ